MEEKYKDFYNEYKKTQIDESRAEKQHKKNKLTARERIDLLLDKNTFVELYPYAVHRCTDFGMDKKHIYGDGVIVGCGKINNKLVYISSQDFTSIGGSMSEAQAYKICQVMEKAIQTGCPFLQINDSGGARIQEGIFSLEAYGKIFRLNTLASGVIPQFSIILGPCAGGAVYSPAITDFVFMVNKLSKMFITGPAVIKQVTHEDVSFEELGGAMTHNSLSGNAHFFSETEQECFDTVRKLIQILPSNNKEQTPINESQDKPTRLIPELNSVIPKETKKSYDMRNIISLIFDNNEFIETQAYYANNAITAFARLNNKTVGVIANQPKVLAGSLDINSADKIARFVRFCDAFNIPLISLVDVPGFLPGTQQEYSGIIRHGAKVLFAFAEATVPKIALIINKAYGGACIAMSSPSLGYDRTIAWANAEIAVMGAEGAAAIIYKNEIKNAEDSEKVKQEKIKEYRDLFANPLNAAKNNVVDMIIEPKYSRIELINALEMLSKKKETLPYKKHGNIPL